MNRILLYTDPGGENFAWDVSRPDLRDEGYLALFELLDKATKSVYLVAGEQLRDMARRGNADYARAFLELHRGDLPGKFEEVPVMPLVVKKRRPVRRVECPEALRLDGEAPETVYSPPGRPVQVQLEGPAPVFDTRDKLEYHEDEVKHG